MLKILQARLQQYVKQELPDVQGGFRKGRETRDQITNICWIIQKAREFQKNIYLCFIDYTKASDSVDHKKLWKTLKEMGITDHLTCLWRRKWQAAPVFLPGKFHGLRSLGGYSPWDHKQSDTTEWLIHTVKGFSVVNEAEVDIFLELPCFLYDPMNIRNLISLLPLWNTACTSRSSWFTYCWSLAWRILSITLVACEMSSTVQ